MSLPLRWILLAVPGFLAFVPCAWAQNRPKIDPSRRPNTFQMPTAGRGAGTVPAATGHQLGGLSSRNSAFQSRESQIPRSSGSITPNLRSESFGIGEKNRNSSTPSSAGNLDRFRPQQPGQSSSVDRVNQQIGSNRSQNRPGSSMRSSIETDPSRMLTNAGKGHAGDGSTTSTSVSQGADGSTTKTDVTVSGNGDRTFTTSTTRDASGTITRVESTSSGNGIILRESSQLTSEGYVHRWTSENTRTGETNIGQIWISDNPFVNVDPDSSYNRGRGELVRPGHKAKDPKMVEARKDSAGPGARPDGSASSSVQPRVDFDRKNTVINPNPIEQQGGTSVYRGYNPNDYVRPPRDPDDK